MGKRYPLKVLVTLIVVAACAYGCYQRIVTIYAVPFFVEMADAHSVRIRKLPYGPLPAGLRSGDRLDLQAMDMEARYAVMPRHYYADGFGMPAHGNYQLSVHRGDARVVVSTDTTSMPVSHKVRWLYRWTSILTFIFLSGIVLLVLWRGRGRAATAFLLWSLCALCASALEIVPVGALPGTVFIVVSDLFSLLSSIGFYWLVETTLGATRSVRVRWLWRGLFIALLLAGTLTSQIIGPVLFVTMGWTGLIVRPFQILWAITFMVPVVMLFVSYRAVVAEQRLKWMLWSGALWAFAVLVNYSQTVGIAIALIVGGFLYLLSMLGFLYAVLRHRAVDVSVFIDHTLVYGSVTALVVGILAATNSLVEHAALGTGASLLVQIVVPLALGIVLGQVRNYANIFVERVFFRSKYLANKALKSFARHGEGYDCPEDLWSATTQIIHAKLKAPGVCVYVRGDGDYRVKNSVGTHPYPASLAGNDPALAAARAGAKYLDLAEVHSALGNDGYVFPMGTQAVLVCANRPGEHYAADERKLLAQVTRQIGMTLNNINMRESLRFVRAVARGSLDPAAAREQALRLESGWIQS